MEIEGLEVDVIRKNIRNLILRVHRDGSLTVSAPLLVREQQIRDFVAARCEWIERSRQRIAKIAERQSAEVWTPRETLQKVHELNALLSERLPYWAEQMGVRYTGVRIKALKSKWGSCNTRTGVLTFNIYLMKWPRECVEYVMIHELTHLIVPNHSPEFYAVMGRYCPQWSACRKMMRGQ